MVDNASLESVSLDLGCFNRMSSCKIKSKNELGE